MAKVMKITTTQTDIPCCAYARVSTLKDEQESSLELQEAYWKQKLQSMPNRVFCGVFADQGISGYKVSQRKEYQKMIDLANAGFIKEIYTKSIYRFGRNTKETLEEIQRLRDKGVAIIFETENINTLTCNQDILLKLKAILSEQELSTMSKNVKFTTRNNFKKGIVPKTRIMGYQFDEQGKMVINEQEAKIVKLIYDLYLKGYGTELIIKQLNRLNIKSATGKDDWTARSIHSILENERYIGDCLLQKTYYNYGKRHINTGNVEKYYIENDHEPIIDKDTFYKVQAEIKIRAEKYGGKNTHRKYPLSGKIICGFCGAKYRHRVNYKIINFENTLWDCTTSERKGKKVCPANVIPETLLNEILLDAYNEYVSTPNPMPGSGEDAVKRIKELSNIKERLKHLYMDKLIDYSQYHKEIEQLDEELNQLVDKQRKFDLIRLYKKPKKKEPQYTDAIVDHIDKVVITGYKIDVVFKNQQIVTKEYKYEHRKYSKNY